MECYTSSTEGDGPSYYAKLFQPRKNRPFFSYRRSDWLNLKNERFFFWLGQYDSMSHTVLLDQGEKRQGIS